MCFISVNVAITLSGRLLVVYSFATRREYGNHCFQTNGGLVVCSLSIWNGLETTPAGADAVCPTYLPLFRIRFQKPTRRWRIGISMKTRRRGRRAFEKIIHFRNRCAVDSSCRQQLPARVIPEMIPEEMNIRTSFIRNVRAVRLKVSDFPPAEKQRETWFLQPVVLSILHFDKYHRRMQNSARYRNLS